MFQDRAEAGERLAERVAELDLKDPVVLALPRGGVPVALPVAAALGAPLDLLLVRKLGMPGHEELAAGAVVDGAEPQVVFNEAILRSAGLTEKDFDTLKARKLAEIDERRRLYLGGRAPVPLAGRSVVVVDDGIATGATMRAALRGLAQARATRIVLAVPVAPPDVIASLAPLVDSVICLAMPEPFWAVGAHYRIFDQVADQEVQRIMQAGLA